MPRYKLIYFNGKGRAESVRALFAVAGVDYEDYRIDKKDWPNLKPEMPFGQLPVLEVDGRKLSQSSAIMRYVARKCDLHGENDIIAAANDGCCEVVTELREKMIEIGTSKEPQQEKEKKIKPFAEDALQKLQTVLERNKGGKANFYSDKISVAEIHFFIILEYLLQKKPTALDEHPLLKDLHERIRNDKRISKYLENRPETEF